MKNLKVVKITEDEIIFDNGLSLSSDHRQDCCESHYLWFKDLTLSEFEGMEFDLSNDDFFEKIEGYGIALKPTNNFPVRIAGYGSNNGYYSTELKLVISFRKEYDITECQEIHG